MQKEELAKIIEQIQKYRCETQTIEVKAAHMGCPTRLYDSLSSFSNQDGGGVLIFGVDENQAFEVVGVYDPQDLMHRVSEQCKQMQPTVRPLFTVADIDDKIVVSAEVPGVDIAERPVFYKGTGRLKSSFVRVGGADEPMSDYEIYSYDAYHRRIRDDLRPVDSVDISQFDKSNIETYLALAKESKANLSRLSDEEILTLTGIVKDGHPTVAGVLLFSKYPQASFPQLCITAVVVPGTEMEQTGMDGERFSANQRIEGTIGQMLDDAMLFVKRNMRIKTIIDKSGKRNDKYEYPPTAIREAVLNALMHRDYSIHTEGTPIRIVMYRDRIEIVNSGGLYGKLTIDRLGKVHADTRNQTITNILEILKLAENRYSGIPTIKLEMKSAGLPEPEFVSVRGTFSVILRNSSHQAAVMSVSAGSDVRGALLDFCRLPRSRADIVKFVGLSQYYAMRTLVTPLVAEGRLKLSIPDKPKSRHQRYVTA